MESFILHFVNDILEKNVFFVYGIFFISSMLQLLFPPYPADVVLALQGYITTLGRSFSFLPILVNAMAGTFAGSVILYKLGYHKGEMVFKYKLIKKYVDLKHRKRAERLFEKYGSQAIFISKFIPGVNAVLLLFAGVFKVRSRIVYASVFASVLIQHALVLLLGRFLGSNLSSVEKILKTYNWVAVAAVSLLLSVLVIYYLVRRRRKLIS